jgi:hypothetical protein
MPSPWEKLDGSKGGKIRAAKLTPEERSEIARKAGQKGVSDSARSATIPSILFTSLVLIERIDSVTEGVDDVASMIAGGF